MIPALLVAGRAVLRFGLRYLSGWLVPRVAARRLATKAGVRAVLGDRLMVVSPPSGGASTIGGILSDSGYVVTVAPPHAIAAAYKRIRPEYVVLVVPSAAMYNAILQAVARKAVGPDLMVYLSLRSLPQLSEHLRKWTADVLHALESVGCLAERVVIVDNDEWISDAQPPVAPLMDESATSSSKTLAAGAALAVATLALRPTLLARSSPYSPQSSSNMKPTSSLAVFQASYPVNGRPFRLSQIFPNGFGSQAPFSEEGMGPLRRGWDPSNALGRGRHRGVDIAAPVGTPLRAPADGVIVLSGPERGAGPSGLGRGGIRVTLRTTYRGSLLFIAYRHLSKVVVPTGTLVSAGQVIAFTGNTGTSTGPHLHLDVAVGSLTAFVDPARFFAYDLPAWRPPSPLSPTVDTYAAQPLA